MRYWPMSIFAQHPAMPARFTPELLQIAMRLPSRDAYYACFEVADRTEPVEAPNLAIVFSLNTPNRRLYVQYPDLDEWLRLERAILAEHEGKRFIMLDALH